jgi:hypothetical protein
MVRHDYCHCELPGYDCGWFERRLCVTRDAHAKSGVPVCLRLFVKVAGIQFEIKEHCGPQPSRGVRNNVYATRAADARGCGR